MLDVLTGLLPYDVARMPHTRIVLLRAVREVGGAADRHPGQVIDTLRRHARDGEEHAGIVADFLDERRELPQAALLFPDTSRHDPWQADREYRLTVLTMQGMTLPRPGSPRDEWTDGESLAVELLNLASWLTQRTIYDADRNLRKGVALDETHFLSQVPTGKVLIDRLARDSRKFNVRALFASQLAGDLLRVSGFASLVNAVFVGRTDDEQAQAEALRLLRVPTGVGYEQMLGTLSPRPRHDDRPDDTPRQFVFADGHGGVEKIRIDLEAPHLDHVREALDTNPDASRIAVRGTPAAGGAHAGPGRAGAADGGPTTRRRSPAARSGPATGPRYAGRAARRRRTARRRGPRPVRRPRRAARRRLRTAMGSSVRPPGRRRAIGYLVGPCGDQRPAGDPGAGGRGTRRDRPARCVRARGCRAGPRRGVALLVVTGLVGASVAARDARVRAEPGVQGGPGAGPAGDGARRLAGPADVRDR